jgi:hypothetical protein
VPVHVPEKDTNLLTDEYIRDSKLVHRDGEWYVHLVCKRSVAVADEYDDVLAVDMGAKWIAVSTLYVPLRPRYTVPRRGNPSSP